MLLLITDYDNSKKFMKNHFIKREIPFSTFCLTHTHISFLAEQKPINIGKGAVAGKNIAEFIQKIRQLIGGYLRFMTLVRM